MSNGKTAEDDRNIGSSSLPAPAADTVRLAGIVLKWLWLDKEQNLNRGETLIREAAANGARIVATSECFLDGYIVNNNTLPLEMCRALAEPVPSGPFYKRLATPGRTSSLSWRAARTAQATPARFRHVHAKTESP